MQDYEMSENKTMLKLKRKTKCERWVSRLDNYGQKTLNYRKTV